MSKAARQSPAEPAGPKVYTGLRGYLLSAACTLAAFALRLAMDSTWGSRFPFVIAFVMAFAVMQAAGLGPAIASLSAGFLLADFYFVTPRHSFAIQSPSDRLNAVVYFAFGVIMLYFTRRTRLALARERDITAELQRLNAALQQSEEKFRLTFDQSPIGAAIVGLDYRFNRVNEQLCRITGYTAAELTALRFPDITHPDDLDSDVTQARQLAAGEIQQYSMEKRYIRKDGSYVWIQLSGRLLRDAHGRALSFLALIEDISERKDAEIALGRLAAIVESSRDAIIGKTLDGRVTSWNAAADRLYGYSEAEMLNQPISRLFPPDRQGELDPLTEKLARGECVQNFETVRVCKDGRRIDVSLSLSPIKDNSGRMVGVSTIARDVSDTKRAAAEREHLIRQLQTALSEVKTLSGLLPICSKCKKIRDDKGYWNQIEFYIRDHSKATFTHGICPDCSHTLYPELYSALKPGDPTPPKSTAT